MSQKELHFSIILVFHEFSGDITQVSSLFMAGAALAACGGRVEISTTSNAIQ